MSTEPVIESGREAPFLVARLAELSGHYRFYAVDLERISREIVNFAGLLAAQLDAGEQPTSAQRARVSAWCELFAADEYDFSQAERAGSDIWLVLKLLSGEFVHQNGTYEDAAYVTGARA